MDARRTRLAGIAILLLITLFTAMGASYRSPNFVVSTHDSHLARQIAEAAEKYRAELAVAWLGKALPNWYSPCTMTVRIGQDLGAGGSTTFMFDRGEVYGWRMAIQGSQQRIFDSVLPHEITHMILASHFREPLPRWADEGAATSVECPSERQKQYHSLYQFLATGRGIAFNQMFAMTEYPRDIMPLYAQGFSLTEYLIRQGGRRKYIQFLESGMERGDWATALQEHYRIQNVGQLQTTWLAWVQNGRPDIPSVSSNPVMVASYEQPMVPFDSHPQTATTQVSPPAPALLTPYSNAPLAPRPSTLATSGSGWKAKDGWGAPSSASVSASVPVQRAAYPDPYATPEQAQLARQQPIQEASQLILEQHRR